MAQLTTKAVAFDSVVISAMEYFSTLNNGSLPNLFLPVEKLNQKNLQISSD